MNAEMEINEGEPLKDVVLSFVTLLEYDESLYSCPAIHRHGQHFRKTVIASLGKRFLRTKVFSAKPTVAFPRGKQLFVGGNRFALADGTLIENVPFINVTPFKQIGIGLSMVWKILCWRFHNIACRHRIIFSFNLSVPHALFILIAARVVNAKAVVYLCDVSVPGVTVPKTIWHRIDAFIQHRIIKYFDGHIVVSDCIARDFLAGQSYVLAEGGVSPSLLENTATCLQARHHNQNLFTIVATGSLDDHNGFAEIIDAFHALQGEHYRLVIAGRGSLQPIIENAVKSDKRISFYGYLEHDKLLSLHASGDVLINMRISRGAQTVYGFPSKTLEYMVSGIPLITTCVGHIEQELSDYCYLLRDETAAGLTMLIKEVEAVPLDERLRIGLSARDYMRTHKTWDAQCEKIFVYLNQKFKIS